MLATTSIKINQSLVQNIILNNGYNLRLQSLNRIESQRRNVNVFSEFGNSLKKQAKENKEFKESMDYFTKKSQKINNTAPIKMVKSVSNKAKNQIKNSAHSVHDYMESEAVQMKMKKLQLGMESFGNTILKISSPFVHNPITNSVHKISNIITNSSSTARYNEFLTKTEREAIFKKNMEQQKYSSELLMQSNENAGTSIVLYQMPFFKRFTYNLKNNSTLAHKYNSIKEYLNDQDGPIMDSLRHMGSKLQSLFEESEMAKTVRRFTNIHPGFSLEKFVKNAQMLYLPEVMEAYLNGDSEVLKAWCGEVTYNVLNAGLEAQKAQGLTSQCKLIDLRNVELATAKLLENDTPVLVLSFNTQEILAFSDKDGKIAVGKEDNIQHCIYAVVFSKSQLVDPKRKIDPRTEGWIIIDLAKHQSSSGF